MPSFWQKTNCSIDNFTILASSFQDMYIIIGVRYHEY